MRRRITPDTSVVSPRRQLRRLRHIPLRTLLRWKRLKGSGQGKRAFLVGNGPSLNRTPLHLLYGETTICFNRFALMMERLSWTPTFFMCADDRVAYDIRDELNTWIDQSELLFVPLKHPGGLRFDSFLKRSPKVMWLDLYWDGFYLDLPTVGLGGTVANPALQVLIYLGYDPIYLIGVDMDYVTHPGVQRQDSRNWISTRDNDPNHFDPRYFGEGKKFHYPRVWENMMPSMHRAARIASSLGVRILNAGDGGQLDAFPRVTFRSLFAYEFEQEIALLQEALPLKVVRDMNSKASTVQDCFPKARTIETEAEWSQDEELILAPLGLGVELIHDALITHLVFGPIANEGYLFVRRDQRGLDDVRWDEHLNDRSKSHLSG